MATYSEFWNRAGPGLLDLGVGAYNRRAAQKEAEARLRAAQGPLFQQAQAGAQGLLSQAGLDPDALAADRFGAQEALLKPVQDKQLADLQRILHAKGMLGVANYNPGVEGITPSGTPMNPHMAAFFAAQNADRARRAAGALDEGQQFAGRLVDRAGNLQRISSGAQSSGLEAQRTQPSRAAGNAEILRGVTGMLMKDPKILGDIWDFGSGMLGGIRDWFDPPTMLGGFNTGFDWI